MPVRPAVGTRRRRAVDTLEDTDFHQPIHQELYAVIAHLVRAGSPHDPTTVVAHLERNGMLAGHHRRQRFRHLADITTRGVKMGPGVAAVRAGQRHVTEIPHSYFKASQVRRAATRCPRPHRNQEQRARTRARTVLGRADHSALVFAHDAVVECLVRQLDREAMRERRVLTVLALEVDSPVPVRCADRTGPVPTPR
ncbi:DnaB-like helicase N-terminal domain-containing protein [Rhodococcus sp. M8-35]|uniref:DnaB-like helicase N-terminal domain-containing protein n=1 Tax=Rhodococcus sp. M8-35 TaxID=3058401 RepID=UPI002ED078FA